MLNPLGALSLLDCLKKKDASCVIQTAASSQVSKMFNAVCKQHNIEVINIVKGSK